MRGRVTPRALGRRVCAALLLVATLVFACGSPQAGQAPAPVLLRLSGSTSMEPLLRELSEAYSQRNTHVHFDISSVGSSAGLEALRRGNAELAMVSRQLLSEEEYDLQTGQHLLAYSTIAQDGIAVVVQESNPLSELSLYEVRSIFEGQTTTWDELGGPAVDITVVSREDGSGTRMMFEEQVMYGRHVTPMAVIMPGAAAVRDLITAQNGAIGYLSMGQVGSGITTVSIDGVRPARRTVEDGTYPITRPFLLVGRVQPNEEVRDFIEFCSSAVGRAIVERVYGKP